MSKQIKCCQCSEDCPIHHSPVAVNAEMLEALKWLCNGDGSDESWKAAEAAIAKAEGRSE